MRRRVYAQGRALLITGALALGAAAPGSARSLVQPGSATAGAARGAIRVAGQSSGLLYGRLRFTGTIPRANAGARVEIERLGHETGWKWAPTAHAAASSNGAFTVIWRPNHIGRFAFRAVIWGTATASPPVISTVYRPALATWYGPGFWGSRTACGKVLRQSTIGVANRTLKCGTKVALYYHGRTTVAPVIDRGPYAFGADWDLTEATARRLGMVETVTIGAVSLPPAPPGLAALITN